MNTDRTAPKEEVDQEDTLGNEARSMVAGNAAVDGATHRGWFPGYFLENACGLRATSAVEVKWGAYSAGGERSSWGMSEQATTLCILCKGRVQISFPQQPISSHTRATSSSGPLASRIDGKHWKRAVCSRSDGPPSRRRTQNTRACRVIR